MLRKNGLRANASPSDPPWLRGHCQADFLSGLCSDLIHKERQFEAGVSATYYAELRPEKDRVRWPALANGQSHTSYALEHVMFRFERCATVKTASELPAAAQFAAEVTTYLNKRHSLNMKFGVEIFGDPRIHWYFDAESLDKMSQVATALMKDGDYLEMLAKVRSIWVEGTLKDTVVSLAA